MAGRARQGRGCLDGTIRRREAKSLHAHVSRFWGPKDPINTRILLSGADERTGSMVCRILLFMWSLGPSQFRLPGYSRGLERRSVKSANLEADANKPAPECRDRKSRFQLMWITAQPRRYPNNRRLRSQYALLAGP